MSKSVPEPAGRVRFASLDGLRAISALLVIAQHLGAANMARIPVLWRVDYGNLGVRVFFVISGFLITSLLLCEHAQTGQISLRDFYIRRAFRILPAYYVFAVIVILLIPTGFVIAQHEKLLPPLLFFSNYVQNRGSSFMHTWSLSVEEQFYLLWPGVLVLLGLKRSVYAALGLMLLAPAMRGLVDTGVIPFYSEYGFEEVCDALATGCILALLRDRLWAVRSYRRLVESPYVLLVPATAIALIAVHPSEDNVPSSTGAALIKHLLALPLLNIGIALVIDRYIRFPASAVGKLLNSRPAQWIGVRSYSLYLWQEVFTLSHLAMPAKLIGTFVSAWISYRYVETPFLALRSRLGRKRAIVLGNQTPSSSQLAPTQ